MSEVSEVADVTLKFAGQVRDQEAAEDFFNARYFTPTLGRFNSADPGNAGADFVNPQSWNGYAYVLGNPLNSVDPSGACDVVIGGVTQAPGSAHSQEALASQLGALSVFPYAGTSHWGGVDLQFGNPLSTTQTQSEAAETVKQAVTFAALQGGPVNIIALSGGAGALADAFRSLPDNVRNSINNITYVAPVSTSPLISVSPSGGSIGVVRGNIWKNFYVTDPAAPDSIFDTNCAHSMSCLVDLSASYLTSRAGSAKCPLTGPIVPASYGSGGGSGGVSRNSGVAGPGYIVIYGQACTTAGGTTQCEPDVQVIWKQ